MSFLGRKVKIQTPDYTVEGTVKSIENQRLVLSDVKSMGTGERLDKMIVEGTQVTNVEILEEAPATIQSHQPQKPKESQIKQTKEIQEAKKEFDFAANLSKFDKKAVFEKIANEGQKSEPVSDKIPINEMVTDQKPQAQRRGVVKRPVSKGSKEASPQANVQFPTQMSTPMPTKVSHKVKAAGTDDLEYIENGPPIPNVPSHTTQQVNTPSPSGSTPIPNVNSSPSLTKIGSSVKTNSGSIPIATALQLSQILTQMGNLGFHPATIAERAAEGLMGILRECNGPVVIIAGTHTVAHWAIAAGRRLALEGKTVVAVSPAAEAAEKLGAQSKSFVASGGHLVATQKAFFTVLQNQTPAVIIDALEGYEMPLVDQLDENEFQAASWLINWADNISATKKISLCTAIIGNSELVSFAFPLSPCQYVIDIGVPLKALMALKLRRFGGVRFDLNVAQVL